MSKDLLQFTSLMDLATTDTTDVRAVRSRLQMAGIYIVDMSEVSMKEAEVEEDQTPRINLRWQGVIMAYQPLKEPEDDESVPEFEGKAFNQFATLWLEDVAEAIGLLKGQYYERAGFATAGMPGGIEGHEGWIDGVVGHRVAIRVRHSTNKDGDTRAYYDWLSPKEVEKAGIDWEDLGRDVLNPDGSVKEDA